MVKKILIEIAKQKLRGFEDGKEVFSISCVTADGDHATPIGNFRILNKERIRRSVKYNAQMNYALKLTSDGIYIHEAYNYIENPNKQSYIATLISDTTTSIISNTRAWFPSVQDLSINAGDVNLFGSHGCIRLAHTDAVNLFNWAEFRMTVVIK